jgi:hypothetical protein
MTTLLNFRSQIQRQREESNVLFGREHHKEWHKLNTNEIDSKYLQESTQDE